MKDKPQNFLLGLLLGVVFIVWGIIMITNNLYGVGFREEYGSYSVVGGQLFIFVGLIFLIVAYFNLSPFNKIRKFFEGGLFKRRKNKP